MSTYLQQRWMRTRRLRRVACIILFCLQLAGGVCMSLVLWHMLVRGWA